MQKIDTHVHFWDPAQLNYPWLAGAGSLERAFTLDDYQEASKDAEVTKIVFVECNAQADENIAEVQWIEKLAQEDSRISAIVAYLDLLNHENINEKLSEFKKHPLVRGIRHNIQGNEPGFCLQDKYIEGVQKAQLSGLRIELCLTHDQLSDVIQLVKLCPEVEFMLNHAAKPGIKASLIEQWQKDITTLAKSPNVYCKLSGLLTEADFDQWTPEEILPYFQHCVQAFGHDRIVYGGDWPVITLGGEYSDWNDLCEALTANWTEKNKLAFYQKNAEAFYQI